MSVLPAAAPPTRNGPIPLSPSHLLLQGGQARLQCGDPLLLGLHPLAQATHHPQHTRQVIEAHLAFASEPLMAGGHSYVGEHVLVVGHHPLDVGVDFVAESHVRRAASWAVLIGVAPTSLVTASSDLYRVSAGYSPR